MAKAIGSVYLGSSLELSLQLAAGTTGVPTSEIKVALRIAGTTNTYLDFNDSTFKTSGWTTRQKGLTEVSASNAPGLYTTSVNLATLIGLPAVGSGLVAEYAATITSPSFTEYSAEMWILTDVISRYQGEYGPGVYIAKNGTTGTVVGVNGIATKPILHGSSNMWTVADALGVRTIYGFSGYRYAPATLASPGTRAGYRLYNVATTSPGSFTESHFVGCSLTNNAGTVTLDFTNTYRECLFLLAATSGYRLNGTFIDCSFESDSTNLYGISDYDFELLRCSSVAESTMKIQSQLTNGFSNSTGKIVWDGNLSLSSSAFKWGSLHIHMTGGVLTLESTFSAVSGSTVRITGQGTLVNSATVSGWTLDTAGFAEMGSVDLTPVTDAISTLAADTLTRDTDALGRDAEMLAHLGNAKVVEPLTRSASGKPLTQEVRLYSNGKDAITDDGTTGLLKKLPYVVAAYDTINVGGRDREVLSKFTTADFLSQNTVAAAVTTLTVAANANTNGSLVSFSQFTTFDSLPAWLTASAPVGTVSVAGGNVILDANLNEADYTNSRHLTVQHDFPGILQPGASLNAQYANPNDGTAAAALTYTGVFFEDGAGTPYLVNYGTSRSGSTMFHEGQYRQKGDEAYHFFNDAGNISNNPAGRFTRIVYVGLDGSGNAMFDTYAQTIKIGTTRTVVGMGVPVRGGLIYYSFGANADPADRISFTSLDLTYDYLEP